VLGISGTQSCAENVKRMCPHGRKKRFYRGSQSGRYAFLLSGASKAQAQGHRYVAHCYLSPSKPRKLQIGNPDTTEILQDRLAGENK